MRREVGKTSKSKPPKTPVEAFKVWERQKTLDKIILANSSDLKEHVSDGVVSLIVTSPPYNVGKSYEKAMTLEEYLEYLRPVWKECWRVLRVGGRLCVNIADTGRQPYVPLHAYVAIEIIKLGFFMRGTIIWDKEDSAALGTAWGSWLSPSNPYLQDVNEFVLVFSKTNERLTGHTRPDIVKDEFLKFRKSIWREMETESATSIGHPAPFPLELPSRFIKLFTYPGDLVMDPFNGSGTTCLAAKMLKRRYLGFDVLKEYVELANERVSRFKIVETL